MYLKKIAIKDVGPIADLNFELPFDGDKPKPLVLVGPNGSGKSTFLSFIVNALINFKQFIHPNTEVEQGKVFRIRSPRFIRAGAESCHARVEFEVGLTMTEDTLNRAWKDFKSDSTPKDLVDRWVNKSGHETSLFDLTPKHDEPRIRNILSSNAVLYFPSDRFELPDWVNERSLSDDLRFPEPAMFEGETNRRIVSRALLRSTLEWLRHVLFDHLLERHPKQVSFPSSSRSATDVTETRQSSWFLFDQTAHILGRVLGADLGRTSWTFGNRHLGIVGATFSRNLQEVQIPNLIGLSAGEAAAFCMFANIIRDFDLSRSAMNSLSDIRGIVLVDEIDLHLHVDLQHRVLPELIKLFPKVQFIVTAHSPLFVMGMREVFGETGFEVRELPTASLIDVEVFSEFEHAFGAFRRTSRFEAELVQQANSDGPPNVIVEGKTDKAIIETAWNNLFPNQKMPWIVSAVGAEQKSAKAGGAKRLNGALEHLANHSTGTFLGVFDHDREGVDQLNALNGFGFKRDGTSKTFRHSSARILATVLPVPSHREAFVTERAKGCHLAIEHFFADERLDEHGMKGEPVANGTVVFDIDTDSNTKVKFADAVKTFAASEFEHFKVLFDRFHELLGTNGSERDALEEREPEPEGDAGGTP